MGWEKNTEMDKNDLGHENEKSQDRESVAMFKPPEKPIETGNIPMVAVVETKEMQQIIQGQAG